MHKSIPGRTWVTLLLTLLLLQGCGFYLRGGADQATAGTELPASISPIMINGLNTYSGLGRELAHQVKSNTVQVTRERETASTMLRITSYRQQSRPLSVNRAGKMVQTELRHSLSFGLLDASGKTLVPMQNIKVVRSYINTEEQKLGKTTEADQLTKEMQRELARMIILRIRAQLK